MRLHFLKTRLHLRRGYTGDEATLKTRLYALYASDEVALETRLHLGGVDAHCASSI